MIRLAVIAAMATLLAAGAAKALIDYSAAQAAPQPGAMRGFENPDPAPAGGAAQGQPASVVKAADGHYWAEGVVQDQRVRFLIDTGASTVALTGADARRLGMDTNQLVYNLSVRTANGEALAAKVRLADVSVAGAKVQDVDAIVVDRGLSTSLLGMSFLGRLSGFDATPGALILRP